MDNLYQILFMSKKKLLKTKGKRLHNWSPNLGPSNNQIVVLSDDVFDCEERVYKLS